MAHGDMMLPAWIGSIVYSKWEGIAQNSGKYRPRSMPIMDWEVR